MKREKEKFRGITKPSKKAMKPRYIGAKQKLDKNKLYCNTSQTVRP
jgi:hypothetical protein